MKKTIALILLLSMMVSLCACAGGKSNEPAAQHSGKSADANDTTEGGPMQDTYTAIQETADSAKNTPDWISAYQDFVLNKNFLNYGDSALGYGDLENGPALITFALHDMNGDDVPELLIFNGFNGRDLQANYVFTYTGTVVAYCGKTLASAYAVDGYPGLFSSMTSSGSYLEDQYTGQYAEVTYLDYHSLDGTAVTKESVSVTGLPLSLSGKIMISRTANEAVYEAGLKTPKYLSAVTWQELNAIGWDNFIRQYSLGEPGSPAQGGEPSWSETYALFLLTEEYLSRSLNLSQDVNIPPCFGLYDLDRNGVPELLLFNGLGPMTGASTYVFTCENGQVLQAGSLREGSGLPYRFQYSTYPGFFVNLGGGTFYQQFYYEITGLELIEIPVRTVSMTEDLSQTSTPLTDNQDLYNYAVSSSKSGSNSPLLFYSLNEIRNMGWEAFIRTELDSAEMTVVYSGNTAKFGPNELAIDSREGLNNANLALLCAMLSDAAYSDSGNELAVLYRQMFEGEPADTIFDYSGNDFCYGMILSQMVITGELTNVLVITIRGTNMNIEEFKADLSSETDDLWGGYQAFKKLDAFRYDVQRRVNDLLLTHSALYDKPLKIIITGHSLGGAAANILGAMFTKNAADRTGWWSAVSNQSDIFVYTFGAIDVININESLSHSPDLVFPISAGYENIHNIINTEDRIVAFTDTQRAAGQENKGKFGHLDSFSRAFKTVILNIKENHEMYNYIYAVAENLVKEQS